MLLLAHIDVVDAKREDWERDPFTLIEENGFFYGRGSADDKSMAAVFLDLMIRLKQERNFRPRRDLIMALTCGEETSNRVNGVDYLLKNRRELIDAAFAINEGAGGLLSEDGKPLALQVQAGEKIHQVYSLEVTNPGGHSSRPVPDNAIYRLAAATQKVAQLSFPIEVNPVVREYFRVTGPMLGGEIGAAMSAVAKDPGDQAALATLMKDPSYNAVVHTTCVATQMEGGHAANALPQRATVTLSCRVMQGTTPEQVKETLEKAIDDPQVKVAIVRRRDGSSAPPLTDEIMGPVKAQAAKLWPGVPVAPLDDRRRDRRALPDECRHTDLWHERHVRHARRNQRARTQREAAREVAVRRARVPRRRRSRVREVVGRPQYARTDISGNIRNPWHCNAVG